MKERVGFAKLVGLDHARSMGALEAWAEKRHNRAPLDDWLT